MNTFWNVHPAQSFTNAAGQTVTLYTAPNGHVTEVEGSVTLWDRNDEPCGVTSVEAGLALLAEWHAKGM